MSEAMLSAKYVDNYLDCVENLPNDLQRYLSRLRELDVTYRECVRDTQKYLAVSICTSNSEQRRSRAAVRLQAALVAAQEIGDEKLQVVQQLQDLIDNKQRALDDDHNKLVTRLDGNKKKVPSPQPEPPAEKEAATPPEQPVQVPIVSERPSDKEKDKGDRDKGGERCKRTRRARNAAAGTSGSAGSGGAGGNTDGADSSERDTEKPSQSTTKKGKKKKRKARQAAQRADTPNEEAEAIDPDEPRYCLCDQISFGEMILCDNDLCPIEWFHFSCVCLTTKPKGKWFCPKCRGDRQNVMKPKGQFLKELERYNREKEDKA